MICPLCAATVAVGFEECPRCGVGLREYAIAHYHPHWLFNEAVGRLSRGEYEAAAALFARVTGFLPQDVEALRGQAHAAGMLGQFDVAARTLMAARALDPSAELDAQYAEAAALAEAVTSIVREARRRTRPTRRERSDPTESPQAAFPAQVSRPIPGPTRDVPRVPRPAEADCSTPDQPGPAPDEVH